MKVYTVTFTNTTNVGAALQEYALQHYLNSQGVETKVVHYVPQKLHDRHSVLYNIGHAKGIKNKVKGVLLSPIHMYAKCKYFFFSRKYILRTKKCTSAREIEILDQPDLYLVGSDQVWNDEIVGTSDGFFLNFKTTAKKASYAASAGKDFFSKEYQKMLCDKLADFSSVSVRERLLKQMLTDRGVKGVCQVLDPVFLVDKNQYEKILKRPKIRNYVLIYEAEQNEECAKIAYRLATEYGLKIVQINRITKHYDIDKVYPCVSPIEFLGLVNYADFVVTNSFHALAISIILEKQFWIIKLKEHSSRIESLLNLTQLKERMVENSEKINYEAIDYMQVNNLLNKEKKDSKEFLNRLIRSK